MARPTGGLRSSAQPFDFLVKGHAEPRLLHPHNGADHTAYLRQVDRHPRTAGNLNRTLAHQATLGKIADLDPMLRRIPPHACIRQKEDALAFDTAPLDTAHVSVCPRILG